MLFAGGLWSQHSIDLRANSIKFLPQNIVPLDRGLNAKALYPTSSELAIESDFKSVLA